MRARYEVQELFKNIREKPEVSPFTAREVKFKVSFPDTRIVTNPACAPTETLECRLQLIAYTKKSYLQMYDCESNNITDFPDAGHLLVCLFVKDSIVYRQQEFRKGEDIMLLTSQAGIAAITAITKRLIIQHRKNAAIEPVKAVLDEFIFPTEY